MTADAVRCDRCRRAAAVRLLAGTAYCYDCAPGKKPPRKSVVSEVVPANWGQLTVPERNKYYQRMRYKRLKLLGLCPTCRENVPEAGRTCCAACATARLEAMHRRRAVEGHWHWQRRTA